jgi:hypothetical protein
MMTTTNKPLAPPHKKTGDTQTTATCGGLSRNSGKISDYNHRKPSGKNYRNLNDVEAPQSTEDNKGSALQSAIDDVTRFQDILEMYMQKAIAFQLKMNKFSGKYEQDKIDLYVQAVGDAIKVVYPDIAFDMLPTAVKDVYYNYALQAKQARMLIESGARSESSLGSMSSDYRCPQCGVTEGNALCEQCVSKNLASTAAATFHEMKGGADRMLTNTTNALTTDLAVDVSSYPGMKTTMKRHNHPHPTLHVGRQYYEHTIYEELYNGMDPVFDIGGTLKRHSIYGRHVHSNQPDLLPEDKTKWINDSKLVTAKQTMCKHRFIDVRCNCGTKSSGAMLIHSVYYFTPQQVADMVTQFGRVIALHHLFAEPIGGLQPEYSYALDSENTISMKVTGNRFVYTHSNMLWLDTPQYVDQGWLTNHTESSDGIHYVTRFYIQKFRPEIVREIKTLEISRTTLTTPIDVFSGSTEGHLEKITMQYWGSFGVHGQHIMSIDAFEAVKDFMAGREHTHTSLNQCLEISKKAHAKMHNFPAVKRSESIITAGTAGFAADVDFKLKTYTHALKSTWDVRQQLGELKKDQGPSYYDRVCEYIANTGTFKWIAKTWLYQTVSGNKRKTAMVVMILAIIWGKRRYAALIPTTNFIRDAKETIKRGFDKFMFNVDKVQSVMQPIKQSMDIKNVKWLSHVVLFAPIYEEILKRIFGVCFVSGLLTMFEVGKESWVLRYVLHVVLGMAPLKDGIALHVIFNAVVAIIQFYQILETGHTNPNFAFAKAPIKIILFLLACGGVWLLFRKKPITQLIVKTTDNLLPCAERDPCPEVKDVVLGQPQPDKPQWFSRIGLGFEGREPYVDASSGNNELWALKNRCMNNPLTPEPLALHKFTMFIHEAHQRLVLPQMPHCPMTHAFGGHDQAFEEWNSVSRFGQARHDKQEEAKFENLGTFPLNHNRTLFVKKEKKNGTIGDPRHIQSVGPKVCAAAGPPIYAWSKCLAQIWNPDNFILYASGYSGQEIGDALRLYPTYFVGDLSRFDRSIHRDILEAINRTKQEYCFSEETHLCLRKQLDTKGYTMKGGHMYKFPGQRKSGDPNTSCDNSEINVYLHLWVLRRHFDWHQIQQMQIMVLGDDIVIGGPPILDQVDFKANLAKLGFTSKPKFVYDADEVEFCSKWFWRVGNTRVLAAKPGRLLAKVGYSHLQRCPAPLSSICQGLLVDNSHVPFVRKYLKHVARGEAYHDRTKQLSVNEKVFETDDQTWYQFTKLYKYGPEDEEKFDKWLDQWDGQPAMGYNEVIDDIIGRDVPYDD